MLAARLRVVLGIDTICHGSHHLRCLIKPSRYQYIIKEILSGDLTAATKAVRQEETRATK